MAFEPANEPATLIIDTAYGSAVAVEGCDPIIESDSRTHVERLQVNIARAVQEAHLKPSDIQRIVVGVGPAPFTSLRAGIVAAKALHMATGADLLGQDILSAQAVMLDVKRHGLLLDQAELLENITPYHGDDHPVRHVTVSIHDARRKQVYAMVVEENDSIDEADPHPGTVLMDMDIDYPEHLVERINGLIDKLSNDAQQQVSVSVIGHGAEKYRTAWQNIRNIEHIIEGGIFDAGSAGAILFARCAHSNAITKPQSPVEPLYLRRPDVSVPNPLKHVLHHGGATKDA